VYIRGGLGFRVEGLGAAEAEGVCVRERESERERERERDTHNKVLCPVWTLDACSAA
jgi:hypothetical protein